MTTTSRSRICVSSSLGGTTTDRSIPAPGDTLLAIEVSDTSLRYDRDVKSGVYAAARVPEFWIVDLAGDALLVFRDPSKGAYKTSLTLHRGESVAAARISRNPDRSRRLVGPRCRIVVLPDRGYGRPASPDRRCGRARPRYAWPGIPGEHLLPRFACRASQPAGCRSSASGRSRFGTALRWSGSTVSIWSLKGPPSSS